MYKSVFLKLLSSFVVFMVLAACGTKKTNTGSEEAYLMKLTQDWSDSVKLFSVDKNLSYYTDNAVMMVPGIPTLGKKEMRKAFERTAADTNLTIGWRPESVHLSQSKDMAYMTEENFTKRKDSLGHTKSLTGKGVLIWRKQEDGSWKVALEIWNNNAS